MPMVIEILDQRIIEMQRELMAHPALMAEIEHAIEEGKKAHESIFYLKKDQEIDLIQSFEHGIAFIAAKVNILMDDTYSYEDICVVCVEITKRLQELRKVVVGEVLAERVIDESKRPGNLPKFLH